MATSLLVSAFVATFWFDVRTHGSEADACWSMLQVDTKTLKRRYNLSDESSSPNRNTSLHDLFTGSKSPNVLDVMALLPPKGAFLQDSQTRAASPGQSVAVCASGHLRTFVLPGVYSSLLTNVLEAAPGGTADLYLVGHLGAYIGSDNAGETLFFDSPVNASDPRLLDALQYLNSTIVQQEIDDGDCSALESAWTQDGIYDRVCREDGHFQQIMWLDHCIRQIRHSGKKYDLIVRTRPDIGVFAAMPWQDVSWDRISYMPKDHDGRADFFFTVPSQFIDAWWEDMVGWYLENTGVPPDYKIFNVDDSTLSEVSFPVAIVRGPDDAQCFRIVNNEEYQVDCSAKAASGFFNIVNTG